MKKHLLNYVSVITLLTLSSPLLAQVDSRLRVHVQDLHASHNTIFAAENTTSVFSALDISTEVDGIRVAATAYWLKQADKSQFDLKVSEAFYDFTLHNWYLSAGKKKLDWDVGYGFRPLDMFSPTQALAIYTAVPPGVFMVVGDYFTESGNTSVLCNETASYYLEDGRNVPKSSGCGGRYYHYFTGFEAQLIGHYDNKLGFRLGGNALKVIGNSLSLHSSLLWQQNYRSPVFDNQALTQTDSAVVTSQWHSNSVQALLGFNYTFASGITVIAEYWHDGRAPHDKQWRALIQASQTSAQPHQLMMMRSHFATQNLFRDNLMLHLRTSSGHWRPELTVLTNPRDNSLLINTRLCNKGLRSSQYCLGLRQYAGGSDSIYEQLSYNTTWYLNMEIQL
ncbi:hypothetical protein CWE09_09370 [Aliidiomarina minuta]|uniref:Porin domain-containing protein n=1 Tax=Aliidiomarina minuta TaxID=880057 RepID=A0A432W9U6_9GAMM|nr:hypothetical protein [Aliidiomarina minuta]RUO26879.1 hypothetical protein CWE09_09370 [Aliidiomarina minuta]